MARIFIHQNTESGICLVSDDTDNDILMFYHTRTNYNVPGHKVASF